MENTKEEINELIDLYETVIHGNEEVFGLLDCYDTYYKGFWDNSFREIDKLKIKLKKYQNN